MPALAGAALVSRSSSRSRLPLELMANIVAETAVDDLRAFALVSKALSRLARPAIWRRIDIDTSRQTLTDLASLVQDTFLDGIADFVQTLTVYITPLLGSVDPATQPASVAAISALLVRLPKLTHLHVEVGVGASLQANALLNSVAFTRSTLVSCSFDWHLPFDIAVHAAVLNSLTRHRAGLRTFSVHSDDATELNPIDFTDMVDLEHLVISGFDISWERFAQSRLPTMKDLQTLDLDSSIDFLSLAIVILPAIPVITSLTLYLVFAPLPPGIVLPLLPAMVHLRNLEIRSVAAHELEPCLDYLAELSQLTKVVITAETAEIINVADVLVRLFTRDAALPTAFAGLETLELQWEGVTALPEVGSQDMVVLDNAVRDLRQHLSHRQIRVSALTALSNPGPSSDVRLALPTALCMI